MVFKAWFPLNVSVFTTNRSCLLVQKLLRFSGFHRQLSSGLLRGVLYLNVCNSRSASGIELKITTFGKSLLQFFCFELSSFFRRTENLFVTCVIGSLRSQSQHISAQALQKFNLCNFAASTQAFIVKA